MKMSTNALEASFPGTVGRLVPLMVSMMIATPVRADEETDILSPYVGARYVYDSNFFRIQDEATALARLGTTERAESYTRLLAGASFDLNISRQRLRAKAEAHRTRFSQFDALDFDGHAFELAWDWVAGGRLNGTAGINERVDQGSFVNIQRPVENLVTTRKKFARGVIEVGAPWKIRLDVENDEQRNSLTSQQAQNFSVDTLRAGLQYQTRKGSTLAFTSQKSEGRYPNREIIGSAPVDNDFVQWDNGIQATWEPTGKTELKGVLNYTRRRYDDVPQRNFSGVTGSLAGTWSVTGKSALKLLLGRNIGVVENTTASYSVNSSVALSAAYKASAKLDLDMVLARYRIEYAGDPGFVLSAGPAREDTLDSLRIGANYAVLRNTRLGIAVQRGINASNRPQSSYTYNSVMLNLSGAF